MSRPPYQLIGIACFVLCAISLFVAWERYQANASNVAAANAMMQSAPIGGMMQEMTGGAELRPSTPAVSKYAIGLAVLFAVGGIVCLVMPTRKGKHPTSSRGPMRSSLPEKLPTDSLGPAAVAPDKDPDGL